MCGACTIEIDGVPARACLTLAVQADGADIRTIEGLAPEPGRLSILQEAFRRHHALQCGFCTAGILFRSNAICATILRPTKQRCAIISAATCAAAPGTSHDHRPALDAAGALGSAQMLISAPASWPASSATRARWRSSMTMCV